MEPKKAVFRIRKRYFDAIVSGDKRIEYRKDSDFWRKRLLKMPQIAVFMCGKRVHRRRIKDIYLMETPSDFSNQGKLDVPTETCFAITLGEAIY